MADAWTSEASALMPVSCPFDGFVEYSKRVSPTCLVDLERNCCRVPASFANRPVSLRVYPERVVIVAEGQVLFEHRRIFERPRRGRASPLDERHHTSSRHLFDWGQH